jgi:hypothetical protein
VRANANDGERLAREQSGRGNQNLEIHKSLLGKTRVLKLHKKKQKGTP